jgi:rhodanese-related sulfurtransferase
MLLLLTLFLLTQPDYTQVFSGKVIYQEPAKIPLVDTETLKEWYDQKRPMVVIDARRDGWYDHCRLPQAIRLPHHLSYTDILKILPEDRNTLIVTYCGGLDCPASGYLSRRLQELGYVNIYEYAEGIPAWEEAGYPTLEDHQH